MDDDYWTLGLSAVVPVIESKLDFALSYEHQESNGEANFTTQGSALENITQSDDYKRNLLEAKAIYKYAKNLDMTLGYIYDKYEYDDAQFNDYMYTVGTTINTYLSGAYADHDYEANIAYFTVKYGF